MKNVNIFMQLTACCMALLMAGIVPASAASEITFKQLSPNVNAPIGIDYNEFSGRLVGSVNYPNGQPGNFIEIQTNGTVSPFSPIAGLTEEIKIATVRSGGFDGGFVPGDFFTGNGNDGEILKISGDGNTVSAFVSLPGDGNGLMRGSLYIDRTGVYGGDLIAVTTFGEVWRVNSAGNPTLLADVNVHLEGLITVPNDAVKYGPLAGKIITGQEDTGSLYAFDNAGLVKVYTDVGVAIEDIDLINDGENFFGMNYGQQAVFGADAKDFRAFAGEILLTQEFHSGSSGLFRLFYDGVDLQTEEFDIAAGSDTPGQWEHVAFAPIRVLDVPEPGLALLIGSGLLGLFGYQRKIQKI